MQIPPGFELQLFAAEPLITGNPEAMAWDERGRLWIAETRDYPNNPQPAGQGNDVIKILEDTNRDGRADKATVFADKLTIVSSLVFANGGIIVSQAGEMVALKDTNGDDKADLRESLIRGWSIRDTHALASNLKYGLDNWVWGAVGYSGFNGTVGGQALNFNQALYRFSRDGNRMEHMANFTNNTWGLAFNETFDVFGSTANGEHSVYVAIPRPYYQGVSGLTGDGKKKIDGHYAMQANTQKVRQVDVHGGFTAAAGHNFYTARAFPEEYWNRIAFVNEPTGHVVHRAIVERQGSGFAEKDGWNIAASDDEWFAPVHAEVGPDGALWLLDFYDFIIQHNPTPIGPIAQEHPFQNGRGNAYDTPLREHDRGRIYRLVWKDAKPYTPLSLSVSRPLELVQALRHDNMFWRTTAQRLIVERGQTDVVPQIIAVVNDRTVDRIGLNSPAVHALWTLHGLGVLDGTHAASLEAATRALSHPAAGVRKAALSVLPATQQSIAAALSAGALTDKDLNVRLNALLALSRMPASVEAGREIYRASKDQAVMEDEWLPEAVWIAATRHEEGFLKAYADEVGVPEVMKIAVRGARGERGGGVDWSAPSLPDADWKVVPAPKVWSETAIGDHVGTIWLRRTIDVPANAAGRPAEIRLGIVDDSDVTYVNGVRIGATVTSRNLPRQYSIPAGVLTAGSNVIAVRISNVNGRGGFVPDPAPAPGVSPLAKGSGLTGMAIAGDGFTIRLEGDWRAKVEESWQGGRRREIVPNVPIAQQFLLANSPVADMMKSPVTTAAAGSGSPSAGAPGSSRSRRPGHHARRDQRSDEVHPDHDHRATRSTGRDHPEQHRRHAAQHRDLQARHLRRVREGAVRIAERAERAAARLRPGLAERPRGLAAAERRRVNRRDVRRPHRAGRVPLRVFVSRALGDDARRAQDRMTIRRIRRHRISKTKQRSQRKQRRRQCQMHRRDGCWRRASGSCRPGRKWAGDEDNTSAESSWGRLRFRNLPPTFARKARPASLAVGV